MRVCVAMLKENVLNLGHSAGFSLQTLTFLQKQSMCACNKPLANICAYLLADAGIELSAGRNGEKTQHLTHSSSEVSTSTRTDCADESSPACSSCRQLHTHSALPPHTVCSSTDYLGISDGSRVEHHMCVYNSRMVSIVGEKKQLPTYFTMHYIINTCI